MLELLHDQWSLADVAEATGTYPREVRRVGWRYLERGVADALTDDPRPLARRYRTATTIHLIMDNLNLHCRAAVIGVLGSQQGAALWARFTPHYTPNTAPG